MMQDFPAYIFELRWFITWCSLTRHTYIYVDSSPLGQNGRHFRYDIFRCIFVNEKCCNLIKISPKFVPDGPIDKQSIGLDNALAPNRRQAIIWTNADPINWRIYAVLWGDESTAGFPDSGTRNIALIFIIIISYPFFESALALKDWNYTKIRRPKLSVWRKSNISYPCWD